MKKSILLTFVLAAGFVATFLTGCGTDKSEPTCYEQAGSDTGYHKIYVGALAVPLDPIRDSIHVTKSGNTVSVETSVLSATLTGTVDASDCNKIQLDSFISTDTIFVPSATFGTVKIWGVRAGGTGTVSATGVATSLKVAKGKTNITSFGLDNLDNKGLELKGSFLRVP